MPNNSKTGKELSVQKNIFFDFKNEFHPIQIKKGKKNSSPIPYIIIVLDPTSRYRYRRVFRDIAYATGVHEFLFQSLGYDIHR